MTPFSTGVRVIFFVEGKIGRITVSAVMNAIVAAIVLFGTAAALTEFVLEKFYLRHTFPEMVFDNHDELKNKLWRNLSKRNLQATEVNEEDIMRRG